MRPGLMKGSHSHPHAAGLWPIRGAIQNTGTFRFLGDHHRKAAPIGAASLMHAPQGQAQIRPQFQRGGMRAVACVDKRVGAAVHHPYKSRMFLSLFTTYFRLAAAYCLANLVQQQKDVKMKLNQLGRTGIMISDLCLGTMTYGTQTARGGCFCPDGHGTGCGD